MHNVPPSRRQALGSTIGLIAGTALMSNLPASAADATKANRALVKAFTDALTAHDLERFRSLYSAESFIQHQALATNSSNLAGREALVTYFGKRIQAFPDLVVTSDASLAEGDLICANFIYSGTHRGEYLGVQPTEKHITFNSTDILKVRNGQFIEHWGAVDLAGLVAQLRS